MRSNPLPPNSAIPLVALSLFLILLGIFPILHSDTTGLPVQAAENTCDPGDSNIFFLQISNNGKILLNSRLTERNRLPAELEEIYKPRAERLLYISAGENVPFQQMVDTISLAQHSVDDLRVTLVTEAAADILCRQGWYNWAKQPVLMNMMPPQRKRALAIKAAKTNH